MIRRCYTDSGFAFAEVTSDEEIYSNADDQDREPIVMIYDLDHQDEMPIPGEPEVAGRFVCSFYRDSLVSYGVEDLQLHIGLRAFVIPATCMAGVLEFLTDE